MAEKLTTAVEIDVSVKSENSVKSIRAELREAVNEAANLAAKFGETSPEATNAAQKVANLRDRMEDLNNRVKALNPDKFQRIATFAGGIASGFSAAQGALALFGAESEDLQKQMVRLQGAMAFAQGIQGIQDFAQSFSGLGAVIKTQVITAFSTLKGAIAATGIGALVVGIGVLIESFSSLASEAEKAAEAQEKALNQTKDFEENVLQLEIKRIENEQKIAASRKAAAGATEEELFKLEQEYLKKKATAYNTYYEALKGAGADFVTVRNAQYQAQAAQDEIEIKANEYKIKTKQAQDAEAAAAAEKAAAEKERKEKERRERELEEIKKYEQFKNDELLNFGEQRIADARMLDEQQMKLIAERGKLNREAREVAAKEELLTAQQTGEARVSIANATASGLLAVNDILAKAGQEATAFSKGVALLQIGIDTATAISSLNAETAKVAAKTAAITGAATPIFTAAYYAQGIARILANVAQAKKVLSGGGQAIQAPTASAPQAAGRTFTGFGLPSDQIEQAGGQQQMRVYVVDSDITRQQKRSRQIQRTSVI